MPLKSAPGLTGYFMGRPCVREKVLDVVGMGRRERVGAIRAANLARGDGAVIPSALAQTSIEPE